MEWKFWCTGLKNLISFLHNKNTHLVIHRLIVDFGIGLGVIKHSKWFPYLFLIVFHLIVDDLVQSEHSQAVTIEIKSVCMDRQEVNSTTCLLNRTKINFQPLSVRSVDKFAVSVTMQQFIKVFEWLLVHISHKWTVQFSLFSLQIVSHRRKIHVYVKLYVHFGRS